MKEEEWIQKAILYFNGNMTKEEEELFLKETESDKHLSALMQLWKQTDAQAEADEPHRRSADDFIQTHDRLKAEFIRKPKSDSSSYGVWRWVAAAALIAGVFFFIRALLPGAKNNSSVVNATKTRDSVATKIPAQSPDSSDHLTNIEILFAQSFIADEVPSDQSGPLEDAYFYYSSHQYDKAIEAIDSLHTRELTRGTGNSAKLHFYSAYYKALSLLSIGNAKEAIPLLTKASIITKSPELRAKSEWYLSLAYLKSGNTRSAVKNLELVKNNGAAAAYRMKAENLLRALN